MAGDMFGPCPDLFMIFDDTLADAQGNRIVRFFSAENRAITVDVCLDPIKGATIDGEPVVSIDGILQLPSDLYGEGSISQDGDTYTVTFPGQDPVEICLNPVKGAVIEGDEVTIINGILQLPDRYRLADCAGETLESGSTVVTQILSPDGSPWPCDENGNTLAQCECPSIALTKVTKPGPYLEGDVVEYQFIVHNDGPVDLVNITISDADVTLSGGPISLAAGSFDSTSFKGTYTYTANDVENGSKLNVAVVTGETAEGTAVTALDAVSVFSGEPEPQLIKKCGLLPEVMLEVEFVEGSGRNPITNEYGVTYNTSADYTYSTPGGTVIATATSDIEVISGETFIVVGDPPIPGNTDIDAVFKEDPGRYFSFSSYAGFNGTNDETLSAELRISFTSQPAAPTDINGCEAQATTIVTARDVDNGSVMSNITRPWDDTFKVEPSQPGGPIEGPAGTFTFPTQINQYLQWFGTDLVEDVSYNYTISETDGVSAEGRLAYRAAVCVMEDADGNIVSAETIDGPLDESEWANIEFI